MQILCHWHCYFAFHAGAQATCAINNVVHLQNQLGESSSQPSHHRVASALSSPQQFCPQTAEEQDENSHAEASSPPASQPVVCSQYRLSKFQEEEDGRDEVNHSTGEPEVLAVNEDASATPVTGCQCQREASHQASSSDPWKPWIRLWIFHKIQHHQFAPDCAWKKCKWYIC